MVYHPLLLDSRTPQVVVDFIRSHVDIQFHEVHVMLRLPLPQYGLDAGCHCACATWLLTLIHRISTVLYKQTGDPGERFQACLVHYYPWQYEPAAPQGVRAEEGAHLLYDLFRHPFTPVLDVSAQRSGSGQETVSRAPRRNHPRALHIAKESLSEEQIESLELWHICPDYAYTTIEKSLGSTALRVVGLYWGVRHMVYQLTCDRNVMAATATFFRGTTSSE